MDNPAIPLIPNNHTDDTIFDPKVLPLGITITSFVTISILFHVYNSYGYNVSYVPWFWLCGSSVILCVCFVVAAVLLKNHRKSSVLMAFMFAVVAISWLSTFIIAFRITDNMWIFIAQYTSGYNALIIQAVLQVCAIIQVSNELFFKINTDGQPVSKLWWAMVVLYVVIATIFDNQFEQGVEGWKFQATNSLLVGIPLCFAVKITFSVILEIQTQSIHQLALNSQGSTGLVLLLLSGGMLAQCVFALIAVFFLTKYQTPELDFISSSLQCFLLIVPYSTHLWSLIQSNKMTQKVCVCFYAFLIGVHFCVIGAVSLQPTLDPLLSVASSSAWLVSLSLCALILSMSSPLVQLFFANFKYDTLYHHICRLHFQRVVKQNFAFFSLIHISAHTFMWIREPHYTIGHAQLYSFLSPTFFSGVGMVLFFPLAAFLKRPFKWRIYSFALALVCLYYHGIMEIFSSSYGTNLLMGTLLVCVLVHLVLNLSNRSMDAPIVPNQSSIMSCPALNGTLLFLVVEPRSPPNSFPGSYFTIYGTNKYGKWFDGQTFPLFSANHQRLAFFLFCQSPISGEVARILHKVSISIKKMEDQEIKLSLIGPFRGPTSLLLEYIHDSSPSVVFLCAAGVGYVHVVSLVAYLREKQLRRRLLKVYVFYRLSQSEFTSLNELFNEISRFYTLGELWESAQNNLVYFAMPQEDQRHIIDFAYSYVEQMDIPAGPNKAVYYCGREGNGHFGSFQNNWQKFCEILP
eukprot:Phypoly_transcript_02290.p1 GENE.Phypoly_transcript_02290~~Phypoly_transcript_02290.p1  ORF type:complete len:752 (+),score=46.69 Phypoly_transcript_02290:28-2256(+)